MTTKQRFIKIIYPIFNFFNRIFRKNSRIFSSSAPAIKSFYDLKATLTNGEEFSFASLKDKKVLIVNTASDCGFTPQYRELEALYENEKSRLEILAFPANDFLDQEKLGDNEISSFCRKEYGVTFPVMRKSKVVVHSAQNAVYEWLTDKDLNGWNTHEPTWNFCKYLVDEQGNLTDFFESAESPTGKNIKNAINAKS